MLAKLVDWSLDNRFLVSVLAVLLALFGVDSMRRLPLDAIPDLSDAQVIVHSRWGGHDPQTVEDQVTTPISSALLGLPRVRDVRGFSSFGTSFVYVVFEDGTDPYWARTRVLENLGQARGRLPEGVEPALGPDASGMGWVYLYTLEDTAGELDLGELRQLQDTFVGDQLTSVPGVAEVASLGGARQELHVEVDPRALVVRGIPLRRVLAAVRGSNSDVGGGVVELAETEFLVRGRASVEGKRDLEAIGLGVDAEGTPVRLGDVARVELGPAPERGVAEKDGVGEVVAGIVTMRYGENALEVIRAVEAKIAELSKGLPEGVKIRKAYDRSELIERSIATLSRQLIEELLIVALVCVLFLWHARSALVGVVVLPLGVLASFVVMRFLGVGANIMSLGGIAVAIGAMVDASVVMVENFHKHKESARPHADHWELVRHASKEVGPALFFSLLVITISFLPVFALEDQAGRLFEPLALTKTLAMASAAVLTLVLMPVLIGYFVRGEIAGEARNPISRLMIACYLPVLRLALRFKKSAIVLACLLLLGTAVPFLRLGSEFMPSIREGDALAMPTTLPGISSTEARRTLQVQDRLLASFPEVETVLGKIGRADTALDPAPLSMVETHISLHPEERWPRRVVELAWLERRIAPLVGSAAEQGVTLPDVPREEIAEQVARMAQASLTRELRRELVAGAPERALREGLGTRVARHAARLLAEYLTSQGALAPTEQDALAARLAEGWAPDLARGTVPLRRTTFEELTKVEMHAEVTVPGMPNWWLMPIETRIGMLSTGMRGQVGIKLLGDDLAELERLATELEGVLQEVPGTLSVLAERALGATYLDVDVDRQRCARFGVDVREVQDALETAVGGKVVSVALEGRRRLPIRVRTPRELRDDPERLARVPVATPGGFVPLGELASLSVQEGPPVVKSENGLLLVNVPIDLEAGLDVGTYVRRARGAVERAVEDGRVHVPTGTYLTWSGQYQLLETVHDRLWQIVPAVLGLILVLIYFNTRDVSETLISMVTLPFALIGGVWLLYWLDYDLSVAVAVGFLALAGLAAETAILMHVYLELAYRRRARSGELLSGPLLEEAIVEGAVHRVRPKMMTVVTTILALVPIMWATGAGAGPMKRMAAPMIGGLVTSTLHTLILIPVYYAMLHEWRARQGRRATAPAPVAVPDAPA